MNLSEYRRELTDAHNEYREALQRAADSLQKRLITIESEFLGENLATAIEECNVPSNRRYE